MVGMAGENAKRKNLSLRHKVKLFRICGKLKCEKTGYAIRQIPGHFRISA
jgi:hypothetical protein